MECTIQLLGAADTEDYKSLRLHSLINAPLAFCQSLDVEEAKPIDQIAQALQSLGDPAEKFVLGAFCERRLIGFVTFHRDSRTKARHKSMIHAMYVHTDYQNRGIGEQLMIKAIAMASRNPGLEQIHLWVLIGSQSAVKFYEKLGFKQQGPLVKNDLKIGEQYVDAAYMVMYLKP